MQLKHQSLLEEVYSPSLRMLIIELTMGIQYFVALSEEKLAKISRPPTTRKTVIA
jgi:hypothetical protein